MSVVLALSALRRSAAAEETRYRTAMVIRENIVRTITATGALNAVNTVTVGAQVSGTISALYADYNDRVSAGDLLLEIESSTYAARSDEAAAELESAEALLELKGLQLRRSERLLAEKHQPISDHEQAVAEHRRQQAAVAKARAMLASAKLDLMRTRIVAPIAGLVVNRSVERGQTVQSNFATPALYTLAEDLTRMEIIANVSEADIGTVAEGQAASFSVDAFPGERFTGTVRQVRNNPSVTQNVVTYPVVILVENRELRLRPGMTSYVTIVTGRREAVPSIPATALRYAPTGQKPIEATSREGVIYVLPASASSPAGGHGNIAPIRRMVGLGMSDRTRVEVVEGLAEGELVVTGETVVEATGTTRNPFLPSPPHP